MAMYTMPCKMAILTAPEPALGGQNDNSVPELATNSMGALGIDTPELVIHQPWTGVGTRVHARVRCSIWNICENVWVPTHGQNVGIIAPDYYSGDVSPINHNAFDQSYMQFFCHTVKSFNIIL